MEIYILYINVERKSLIS